MPTDKQQPDFAQALTPVREAQAALMRAQGLSMGAAMEQAFASLVGKLDAEPVAAQFEPLPSSKRKPAQQPAAQRAPGASAQASGGSQAEQALSSPDAAQGVLAGLTQELMAQAFAQAITEAAKPGRVAGQAPAASKQRATPSAPGGSGSLGALGQVNLGQALRSAVDSVATPQRAGTASPGAQQGQTPSQLPQLGRAMAAAGEQVARVATGPTNAPANAPATAPATAPASAQPKGEQVASMVPTAGAWQALSGIEALVKELARLDASAGQASAAPSQAATGGAAASRSSTGGAPAERFPAQGFEVQAGRPAADTAKATDPGLLGTGKDAGARGNANFDSAPSQAGSGLMPGGLEGLVNSVWAAIQAGGQAGGQAGVQQAGASKPSARPGALQGPQRLGASAGEQAVSSGTTTSGTAPSGVAPRTASMLAPAGQRAAASSVQQELTGGKVLAAVRMGESANDALNPAAPGAVPTAGYSASSLSDEALAEQLNRVLIEQAWRGGVDLS